MQADHPFGLSWPSQIFADQPTALAASTTAWDGVAQVGTTWPHDTTQMFLPAETRGAVAGGWPVTPRYAVSRAFCASLVAPPVVGVDDPPDAPQPAAMTATASNARADRPRRARGVEGFMAFSW
jgi:hypothetical protein